MTSYWEKVLRVFLLLMMWSILHYCGPWGAAHVKMKNSERSLYHIFFIFLKFIQSNVIMKSIEQFFLKCVLIKLIFFSVVAYANMEIYGDEYVMLKEHEHAPRVSLKLGSLVNIRVQLLASCSALQFLHRLMKISNSDMTKNSISHASSQPICLVSQ